MIGWWREREKSGGEWGRKWERMRGWDGEAKGKKTESEERTSQNVPICVLDTLFSEESLCVCVCVCGGGMLARC